MNLKHVLVMGVKCTGPVKLGCYRMTLDWEEDRYKKVNRDGN